MIYLISSSKGNPNFINRPVVLKQEFLIFLLYSENNTICLNNREFLENSRILYKSPSVIWPGVYWRTSLLISSFLTRITMEFNVMWLLMAVFLGSISHGKNRLSGVVVKRSSRMREIGVRFPVGTHLHVSRWNRFWQLHCQTLVCMLRVLEDDHYKGSVRVTVGIVR